MTSDDFFRNVAPGNVEPSADLRAMASFLRQLYVALRSQGFTDHQALQVIGMTIAGSMASPKSPDDDDGEK